MGISGPLPPTPPEKLAVDDSDDEYVHVFANISAYADALEVFMDSIYGYDKVIGKDPSYIFPQIQDVVNQLLNDIQNTILTLPQQMQDVLNPSLNNFKGTLEDLTQTFITTGQWDEEKSDVFDAASQDLQSFCDSYSTNPTLQPPNPFIPPGSSSDDIVRILCNLSTGLCFILGSMEASESPSDPLDPTLSSKICFATNCLLEDMVDLSRLIPPPLSQQLEPCVNSFIQICHELIEDPDPTSFYSSLQKANNDLNNFYPS